MTKKEKQSITSNVITLSKKHQLNTVIVDSRGRPDTLAINLYWDEFRSWYNPKKIKNRKATDSSKLKKDGISISYKKLATKHSVSENTIRRKLVQLEGLGLISRDFEKEKKFNKVFQNQLIVHVWKQTSHFYNPFGIDREQIKNVRQYTSHEYVAKKYNKKAASSNDNHSTSQSQLDKGVQDKGGVITDKDRGCHHKVKSTDISQPQSNKAIEGGRGVLKNENQKVEVKNTPKSQANTGVEAQGGVIIRDDRGVIVDEDTYILREELESYTSFQRSSFKEKTNKKESYQIHYRFNSQSKNDQSTNCSNAILTEHSQFAPSVDDRNITTKQQPIENINDTSIATKEASLVTEMLPMDQQENAQPDKPQEISYAERLVNEFLEKSSLTFAPGTFGIKDHEQEGDKQTRKMLLSKALCSAFGEQVAGDIQDNCKFEEISPHKVTIKLRENITFNDIDKTKIRKAIQSVYGDDVTIALGSKEANVDNHAVESEHGLAREDVLANKASLNTQHSCWLEFKGVIQDRRVHELLCNPTLKIIELADKIIVEAYSFLVDEISSSACLEELESAIVQTGITLEVHDKHVPRSYAVPERKPTVLTKEKILKDRAWRQSFVEKMDELAEDDPKRDSFLIAFKNSKQVSRWWQW